MWSLLFASTAHAQEIVTISKRMGGEVSAWMLKKPLRKEID